jgi:poly(ADP-ribose) glycohydrolase
MALVMLPCDLPWWPAVTKQLDKAAAARDSEELIDAMQRVHDMCKYEFFFIYNFSI